MHAKAIQVENSESQESVLSVMSTSSTQIHYIGQKQGREGVAAGDGQPSIFLLSGEKIKQRGAVIMNTQLLELLRKDLTRPRELDERTASALSQRLEVENPLDAFTPVKLACLEEFEQEILISPLFTPGPEDRQNYEAALSPKGAGMAEQDRMVASLVQEGIAATLQYGGATVGMTIPEVVLSRYVRLLYLDRSVPDDVALMLNELATSEKDRHWALSLARKPVWKSEGTLDVLVQTLEAMRRRASFSIDKLSFLSDFVRTYRCCGIQRLIKSLENLVEAYQTETSHPVFSDTLEDYQTNSIKSQYCGERVKAYRIKMAHALLADLR